MFSNKNKRAKKIGFQYAIVVMLCIQFRWVQLVQMQLV